MGVGRDIASALGRLFGRAAGGVGSAASNLPAAPVPVATAELQATTLIGQQVLAAMKDWMGLARATGGRGWMSDPTVHMNLPTAYIQRMGILSYEDMRRMYRQNGIVRAVVDTKIRQILGMHWTVQRDRRYSDRFIPQWTIDRVTTLFQSWNSRDDYTTGMKRALLDYLVIDTMVLEVVRDVGDEPIAIVPLDAATIREDVDPHGRRRGFLQTLPGRIGLTTDVQFKPDDLIYIQGHPSTDSIWGLAPLESIALEVGSHLYATKHNADQFTSGNMSDNLLLVVGEAKQALEDLNSWMEANRGKAHLLPSLNLPAGQMGASAQLLKLVTSNRDMEFMQFIYWLFRLICAVFQVEPNQVILLETMATKASTEEMSEIHAQKGLWPDLIAISSAFTRSVVSRFHPFLEFAYVEADKLDAGEEASVFATLVAGGLPLNEARERSGLKPIEGPMVRIGGDEVNIYDLPCNPSTGLPWGWELMETDLMPPARPAGVDGEGAIFPMGDDAEGGDEAGFQPPWAKNMPAAFRGRRQQGQRPRSRESRSTCIAHSAHQGHSHRPEDARYRALMSQAAQARVSRAHAARIGACRSGSQTQDPGAGR